MLLKALRLLLFLYILSTLSSCQGQETSVKKEGHNSSFSKGELVSELDSKIWNIYQDQSDRYWFGSNGNGLFLYDGEELRKFTIEDGLIDNSIRGMQGDKLGNIFIETPKGVSKYDGSTFTTLEPILSSKNQWKLEADDLWFNCNGNPQDVYRYDGKSLFQLKLPRKGLDKAFGINAEELSYSPYAVFGINRDSKGNIWFGTVLAGAFRYDGKSFLWIAEKELSRLPDGREPGVRSIIEDISGNFWLSNFISKYALNSKLSSGYERLKGVDMSKGQFTDRIPYFNSGLLDNNGDLWMTTYGGGVWNYNGENLVNIPVKDDATEVLLISIYKDNDGALWLGTNNAGVYKYNGESFENFEPMK